MFWKRFLFFSAMSVGGALISYLIAVGIMNNINDIFELKESLEPGRGYKKVFSSLNQITNLNDGIIYRMDLKNPMFVHFYIIAGYEGDKWIELQGDRKIIGVSGTNIDLIRGDYPVSRASFLLRSGHYEVIARNPDLKGELNLYISNEKADSITVSRLLLIDSGVLNRPPDGYEKIYEINLDYLEYTNLIVYEFSHESRCDESFSIYGRVKRGKLSVKLQGKRIKDLEFINETHPVCDQFTVELDKGEYRIVISADHPEGELLIYRKKNFY